jgi:large subunit ribosomal protein L18e
MKNQLLNSLIVDLKKASIKENVKIWKRIASDLEKPTKQRRIVNLSKIDRYAKNNDVIVVPGKVLSMGELNKKVTVAAYNFSGSAVQKITDSGSKTMMIPELIKKNPKGSKVRIMG